MFSSSSLFGWRRRQKEERKMRTFFFVSFKKWLILCCCFLFCFVVASFFFGFFSSAFSFCPFVFLYLKRLWKEKWEIENLRQSLIVARLVLAKDSFYCWLFSILKDFARAERFLTSFLAVFDKILISFHLLWCFSSKKIWHFKLFW